jgi:hypothetical protein
VDGGAAPCGVGGGRDQPPEGYTDRAKRALFAVVVVIDGGAAEGPLAARRAWRRGGGSSSGGRGVRPALPLARRGGGGGRRHGRVRLLEGEVVLEAGDFGAKVRKRLGIRKGVICVGADVCWYVWMVVIAE